MKRFFCGIIILNVSYLSHHLLICMYQLQCIEQQIKLTYNVGYLPSSLNHNMRKYTPRGGNDNINIGNFHHDIIE